MEATNVTSPHSEPDQDNSSLQNPSTNPAEAGTTDEPRDEDHETSSIEALNWSEVEEEELAAAQQAEALAQGKSLEEETKMTKKKDEDEKSINNGSSTNGSTVLVNEEGKMLSTSLLQSINSSVSDEDPQARKLSVIENWASEVTNAVERGEIEMAEDFPDEENDTPEGEEDDQDPALKNGVRKRKGKKLSPDMISSMTSSVSNGDSSVDPLSNAPVLDDGPIWNKGPKSYRFQENRTINQKLTFCVLIAVVLAIGLGLGNLVAHQECEAEYKASQQSQSPDKPVERIPVPTTPPPGMPKESSDNVDSSIPNPGTMDSKKTMSEGDYAEVASKRSNAESNTATTEMPPNLKKTANEPIIDPKYKIHAETLSRVVSTLDRLSQRIDQFENTTRKLQGVLVIPDEEKSTEATGESSSLYDEKVYSDDKLVDDVAEKEKEDEENEMARVDNLIDAIEETPSYTLMLRYLEEEEEYDKRDQAEPRRSSIFDREDTPSADELHEIDIMLKSLKQLKEFERRFVKSERKRLREAEKYEPDAYRTPEQYSTEEKKAISARYNAKMEGFKQLIREKSPDPINALFGTNEEDNNGVDDSRWPWLDPVATLSEDKKDESLSPEENSGPLISEEDQSELDRNQQAADLDPIGEKSGEMTTDDLVILQEIEPVLNEKPTPPRGESQGENIESLKIDLGKSDTLERTLESGDPMSSDNSQSTPPSQEGRSPSDNSASVNSNKIPSKTSKKTVTSTKAKKSKRDINADNKSQSQTTNGKSGNKRDVKQKEQKKQGKSKAKSSNPSESNGSGNVKTKVSGKLKKFKNLESNRVFENIQGRSNGKRGASPDPVGSKPADTTRPGKGNKKSTGASKEKRSSTGSVHERGDPASSGDKLKVKPKQNGNNGNHKNQQRNNNGRQNGPQSGEPRYYDPNEDSGNEFDKSTKVKYEHDNFSSKETQYRQQKQEFNSNYDTRNHNQNPGHHNTGKKSIKWQNKERERSRERSRERTSSWGN